MDLCIVLSKYLIYGFIHEFYVGLCNSSIGCMNSSKVVHEIS